MKPFDVYSGLLRYPTDIGVFRQALTDVGLSVAQFDNVSVLQEEYVGAFDFNPKAALTLTVHVTSSDKDRTDIMGGMNALLKAYGVERTGNAPPDFLPDVLYAYQRALDAGENEEALLFLNGLLAKGCGDIAEALSRQNSLYSGVMLGLCSVLESGVSHV